VFLTPKTPRTVRQAVRQIPLLLVCMASFLAAAVPAHAASAGDLDPSFSGDGRQTTDFAGRFDGGSDVALQPGGKVVVAGGSNSDFALARYNADGSLDTSFSGDGKETTDFAGDSDSAWGVAVQPGGKVVVAGGSNSDFALARYNADGSLDTSFSDDGKQTTDFGGGFDYGSDVAIQPDGKIVVVGEGAGDFALARYDADGSLDASFSGDGKQTTDFAGGYDGGRGVALQPDGKIVAVGSAGSNFALARYLGAARPDCTVAGSSRNDVLVGTAGDDVICAGAGNDVVRAGGGNDTVYGGPGNDVVRGGGGSDRLYGQGGNDALRGDAGSDRLYGQGGNDALRTSDGRRGNDLADGGGGNDACRGDPGDRRRSCFGR